MRTIAQILLQAGPQPPGFLIHIDNPPWPALEIQEIQASGPNGLTAISVAHYGHERGKRMHDPEMIFEVSRRGDELALSPFYWRNDYLGIEQYSSYRDDEQKLFTLGRLMRLHELFSQLWDSALRQQGYLEAFARASGHCLRRNPTVHSSVPPALRRAG